MTLPRNELLQEKVTGQAVGATGFEPLADFERSNCSDCGCVDCEMCCAANALHSGRLDWLRLTLADAELHRVIAVWATLPTEIKRAVVAVV